MTSISQSSKVVLIRGCSSACRLNQLSISRWYPGRSSFDIIVSHICRESAHSNVGSGFILCSTGVSTAAWRMTADVSAVSVGVVLFTTGRMPSGSEGQITVHAWALSGIGAHRAWKQHMQYIREKLSTWSQHNNTVSNCHFAGKPDKQVILISSSTYSGRKPLATSEIGCMPSLLVTNYASQQAP